MKILIATPYSHLWTKPSYKKRLLSLPDAVELRDPVDALGLNVPLLFHCELSLIAR